MDVGANAGAGVAGSGRITRCGDDGFRLCRCGHLELLLRSEGGTVGVNRTNVYGGSGQSNSLTERAVSAVAVRLCAAENGRGWVGIGSTVSNTKQQAQSAPEQAKEKVREVAQEAKGQTREQLDQLFDFDAGGHLGPPPT